MGPAGVLSGRGEAGSAGSAGSVGIVASGRAFARGRLGSVRVRDASVRFAAGVWAVGLACIMRRGAGVSIVSISALYIVCWSCIQCVELSDMRVDAVSSRAGTTYACISREIYFVKAIVFCEVSNNSTQVTPLAVTVGEQVGSLRCAAPCRSTTLDPVSPSIHTASGRISPTTTSPPTSAHLPPSDPPDTNCPGPPVPPPPWLPGSCARRSIVSPEPLSSFPAPATSSRRPARVSLPVS